MDVFIREANNQRKQSWSQESIITMVYQLFLDKCKVSHSQSFNFVVQTY